jgi:cell division protein FtsW (lipid II flippase)
MLSLGAYLILSANKSEKGKKLAAITHGISVLIIFVAGFGLLARLDYLRIDSWPIWVWPKVIIWLILALIIILIKRIPNLMPVMWFLIPILSGLAAFFAIYKVSF